MAGTVSTKQQDFLEQDTPIRGQNFAVVSFVSPEEILKSKEVFAVGVFLKDVSSELDTMMAGMSGRFGDDLLAQGCMRGIRERYAYLWDEDGLQAEYNAFRKTNDSRIDAQFSAIDGTFRTSVRGLKIRGVYESEIEARNRVKTLQVKDPLFDVYVMEVGCWCPWSPDPESVGDSEYNETQLNTLVKKYKENSKDRDAMYEKRKRDMMDRLGNERDIWAERNANEPVDPPKADDVDGEGGTGRSADAVADTAEAATILPVTVDSPEAEVASSGAVNQSDAACAVPPGTEAEAEVQAQAQAHAQTQTEDAADPYV